MLVLPYGLNVPDQLGFVKYIIPKVKWGPGQPRVRTSEANWRLPKKWDREAAELAAFGMLDRRPRVFCASLADVFEVGVAIVGNPSAPALQKVPRLIEVRRVCTDGTRNACSKLYGSARRACREMGYETVITYTLPSEGGASLRAAGFTLDKTDAGGPAGWWKNRPGRKGLPIEDDLVGGKWRWVG